MKWHVLIFWFLSFSPPQIDNQKEKRNEKKKKEFVGLKLIWWLSARVATCVHVHLFLFTQKLIDFCLFHLFSLIFLSPFLLSFWWLSPSVLVPFLSFYFIFFTFAPNFLLILSHIFPHFFLPQTKLLPLCKKVKKKNKILI